MRRAQTPLEGSKRTRVRIHLITNLFQPDELAGAALYTDLAEYLKARGHDVRVTTTFSYYPAWKLRPEDKGIKVRDETFRGIPVRRVWMYVPERPGGLRRVASDLTFFWSLFRRATFEGWTPDVVLTASPMFSQCLAQRFLYLGKKIPRVIVVQDFVVDAALELGMLNAPGIASVLPWLERWSFASADTLITISQAMMEKLRKKMGGARRTVLLPNWIHRSLQCALDRESAGAENGGGHTAPGDAPARRRDLLFYSGNLGVKQGLPDFVRSFRHCRAGYWRLKIHGGGAEAAALRNEVNGADAIEIGGVLAEADYVRELRSATACLITQKSGIGANFLPSKLLPALASGTPVLAVCDEDTPLGAEVRKGRFGEVARDEAALAETLRRWSAQPALLAEMSRNALEYGRRYHRDVILARYEEELALAASRNTAAAQAAPDIS